MNAKNLLIRESSAVMKNLTNPVPLISSRRLIIEPKNNAIKVIVQIARKSGEKAASSEANKVSE
ncbi:unannotated protein [freshwater metagenome]|uniref:Unannotated protein n=1 Tax=freshwater metagenome TaxID=449393 RepID=A0A6J6SQ31_9ZZZZ